MSGSMSLRSLAFHGLAIKRHADAAAVASLTGLDAKSVQAELEAAVATGRAIEAKGAYSLTPLARVALAATYGRDFGGLRSDESFARAYHGFERINPDLKQIITDWQTVNVRGVLRANDHQDEEYDNKVIDRLSALHERFEPIMAALSLGLSRLAIYGRKLEAALDKAEDGGIEWVSNIQRESYHTVWFELHEELLRIMGTEREE
jgi:hypothetical protein